MHPNQPRTDAELEALLRSLPREAPTTGFADRVMAQVQLPAAVAVRRRIPWRALAGLAALDLAIAAGLLVWLGDALLHGVGDLLRDGAKVVAGVGAIDPEAAFREFMFGAIRGAGTILPEPGTLPTVLLIGAAGALLTLATLGRLARSAVPTSR